MRRGVRVAVGLAGALALLVMTIAFLAGYLYPVDRFRSETEERLSDWLGAPVKLGEFSVSVWGGIGVLADGIRVGPLKEPRPAAGAVLTAESARARLAFWPLIRGDIQVRGLELSDAELGRSGRRLWNEGRLRIDFQRLNDGVLRGTGSLEGLLSVIPSSPLAEASFHASLVQDRLELREVTLRIEGGALTASGTVDGLHSPVVRLALDGEAAFGESRGSGSVSASWGDPVEVRFESRFDELRGVDIAPLVAMVAARDSGGSTEAGIEHSTRRVPLRAAGTIRAEHAELGRIRIEDVRANLVYENEQVELPDVRFGLYGGSHSGRLSADLSSREVPFRWTSRLEGVDVGSLADAFAGKDRRILKGTGSLELDLSGEAPGGRPDRSSIHGTVAFGVVDGSVLNFGVLTQVATLADRATQRDFGREDTPFRSMSARFLVESGLARTTDLALRSVDVDLDGTGSIALDGTLDLDLVASLAPAITASLEARAPSLGHWNRADGRLACPIRVAGTVESPRVKIDLDRAASQGLAKFLEEKGKRGVIRRLLGGR